MKKLILFSFVLFLFSGCEKEFDTVFDPVEPAYMLNAIQPLAPILLKDNPTPVVSVSFKPGSAVPSVWVVVMMSNGEPLITEPTLLYDSGSIEDGDAMANDLTFSGRIAFQPDLPVGIYRISYYLGSDPSFGGKLIGTQSIRVYSGNENFPPEISDLTAPDSVTATDTVAIFLSIRASDLNGQQDIKRVEFIVYRPNGTTNGNYIQMLDDGGTGEPSSGDLTAGDGVYSVTIVVNQTNTKGTYRFDFRAVDQSDAASSIIPHFLTIL